MGREQTQTESPQPGHEGVRRLNWGCGDWTIDRWINADIKAGDGVDLVGDIRDGLKLDSDSIDYAVSIHSLPEIPYTELVPTLVELRRVLKPGGVLRLALPDLDKGIEAYHRRDSSYFKVPDEDAGSVGVVSFATGSHCVSSWSAVRQKVWACAPMVPVQMARCPENEELE